MLNQLQVTLSWWRLCLSLALVLVVSSKPVKAAEGQGDARRGAFGAHPEEFGDSVFPRQMGLESRWETFLSRTNAAKLQALEMLLEESAEGSGLAPAQAPLYTAIWSEVDRFLLGQASSELASLRQAQDRKAGEVGLSGQTMEPLPLLAAFRRVPLAAAFQQAMLNYGEGALRAGNSGVALRACLDVLAHAANVELRTQAQVGVWLALANETQEPPVLQAAFAGVAPEALFPWLGETRSASFIRQQILAGLKSAEGEAKLAPDLAALPSRVLRGAPFAPWNYRGFLRDREAILPLLPPACGDLQTQDRFTLLSGPNLLVGYGENPAQPLWARMPPAAPSANKRRQRDRTALPIPGIFRPALASSTVVTRWGFDASRQYLTGLAAFHRDTGEMLWSTENDPEWHDLWPVNDPTVAEGAVYVLALREGEGALSPLWLLCLRPDNGRLLWKRVLASRDVGLAGGPGAPYLYRNQIDLAHYGNAVTVRRGGVFCVTQLGFVARCDPRDGMVDWIYPYPRVQPGTNLHEVIQRQGAAPVLSGNAVICLPRDAVGLFALEAQTGRLLWENATVRARTLLGAQGELVLARNEQQVLALDVRTGQVAWEHRFDEGLIGEPQLLRASLYVNTPRGLHRLDATSGIILEQRKWDGAEPVRQFTLTASNVLVFRDDSAVSGKPTSPESPARRDLPLALPLEQVWDLPGDHPLALDSAAGSQAGGHRLLPRGRSAALFARRPES